MGNGDLEGWRSYMPCLGASCLLDGFMEAPSKLSAAHHITTSATLNNVRGLVVLCLY